MMKLPDFAVQPTNTSSINKQLHTFLTNLALCQTAVDLYVTPALTFTAKPKIAKNFSFFSLFLN
jgi:hypothetical protein